MFKKKDDNGNSEAGVGIDSSTRTHNIDSYISPSILVVGMLKGQGNLQVDGIIEGDIAIEGDVWITQDAEVYGHVNANNIYIAGVVYGDAVSKENLEIKSTGVLTGDASTEKINIETGGTFLGKCKMSIPDDKESLLKFKQENEDLNPEGEETGLEERYPNVFRTIKELEEICQQAVRGLGLVRYNAFEGVGGDQSFSAAFVDGKRNGFLITSIFGQEDCRVYAKPLTEGASDYELSEEEHRAIDEALRNIE